MFPKIFQWISKHFKFSETQIQAKKNAIQHFFNYKTLIYVIKYHIFPRSTVHQCLSCLLSFSICFLFWSFYLLQILNLEFLPSVPTSFLKMKHTATFPNISIYSRKFIFWKPAANTMLSIFETKKTLVTLDLLEEFFSLMGCLLCSIFSASGLFSSIYINQIMAGKSKYLLFRNSVRRAFC